MDSPSRDTIDCAVGRGAHLTLVSGERRWRVRVGQGDDRLRALNGGPDVEGVMSLRDGSFLVVLPGYGPARYDPAARHLELWDAGLPGEPGKRPPC